MQCYILRTELDGWLSQLNWPVTALLQYSNKSECLHFQALGTHSLEILTFTPLLYGLASLSQCIGLSHISISSLHSAYRSKQRNINPAGTQQDERWETSQDFLCISSISITILFPHLSSSRHHILNFVTVSQS